MIFLNEKHDLACKCSYCTEFSTAGYGSFGYRQPECWASNAWRGFYYVGKHHVRYIRWTMPRWLYDLCHGATCEGCTIGRERRTERVALTADVSDDWL